MNADEFAATLFEEAKRFYEKSVETADSEAKSAYSHAALLLGFSSFEAHLNALAEEIALRKGLQVLERSILLEPDFQIKNGTFQMTKTLKMYRLEDRVAFLFVTFARCAEPKKELWWGPLMGGVNDRNGLVHPKSAIGLLPAQVAVSLKAMIDCLNALYVGVFSKPHPAHGRNLDSRMTF